MYDRLCSELDAMRQHLQETADQMSTLRVDIRGKLRQRRWLRPMYRWLAQFRPKEAPIWSPVIRWIHRIRPGPTPPAGPYAGWIEKLDEIFEVMSHDPAQ